MNAVPAGLGANVDNRIADTGRFAAEDFVLARNPEAEDIDKRILRVNIVEDNLAADGRHAHAVAVPRYAGHDASKQVAIF